MAIEPPGVRRPRESGGNPIMAQNHWMTSTSMAASRGAAIQTPTYRLMEAAIRSATAEWSRPPPGIYAM